VGLRNPHPIIWSEGPLRPSPGRRRQPPPGVGCLDGGESSFIPTPQEIVVDMRGRFVARHSRRRLY
jgi:hypothetical protein